MHTQRLTLSTLIVLSLASSTAWSQTPEESPDFEVSQLLFEPIPFLLKLHLQS
jgi:hypothetical protein